MLLLGGGSSPAGGCPAPTSVWPPPLQVPASGSPPDRPDAATPPASPLPGPRAVRRARQQGFSEIQNLEEFTGLRSLFLEGNCLEALEGLEECTELRCLFVQHNLLNEIDDIEHLQDLVTLNVSSNYITHLSNLAGLPKLETFQCAKNKLKSPESIIHLKNCPSITVLDLSHNELEDPECLDIIKSMPNLACVYLQGNPVVGKTRYYRKGMVAAIPTLKYLDDRPVFEMERKCAEAFAVDGLEGERNARVQHKEEQEAKDRANYEYMKKIREEGWRKRREREGLEGEGDPYFDDLSDEEWALPEEPQELVEARAKLAAYEARRGEEEPPELAAARDGLAQAGASIAERMDRGGEPDVFITELHTSEPIAPEPAAPLREVNFQSETVSSQNKKLAEDAGPGKAPEAGVWPEKDVLQSRKILIEEIDEMD